MEVPKRPRSRTDPAMSNQFSVKFNDKIYNVDRLLQERPIAVVLAVSRRNKRYIIKIYPKSEERYLFKGGFACESSTYKRLRDSGCTAVPFMWASTTSLTAIYSKDSKIPRHRRLSGEQRAIMLEYLDGEMLVPANTTPEIASRALKALRKIHDLRICHGDVFAGITSTTPRNVMLLRNGDVKWIDFERATIGAPVEDLKQEFNLVVDLIGPKGCVWQQRYRFVVPGILDMMLTGRPGSSK